MTTEYKDPATWELITTDTTPSFVAGDELARLAQHDERIVVLTADLKYANRTSDFEKSHPSRFINIGISEENMVTIAAGLAASGKISYCATFAAFIGVLSTEQIKTDCAYTNLPVRILATHSGMAMGYYGTSHHALEDLSIMRTIANLTVVCAADANATRGIIRATVDRPGPVYIRLGRGRDQEVYPDTPELEFGRANVLHEGTDLTLIATGSEVRAALDAAEALAQSGVQARVLDMWCIKPLDKMAVMAAARETGGIVSVEEHNVTGGLGSAIAEVLADNRIACPFLRHGVPDEFVPVGPPLALYAHYRLDGPGVAAVAGEFLQGVH